jgi:hypothetical protein
VHAQCEDKGDDEKGSFYKEVGRVFDQFPRYSMKVILGEFNAKVARQNMFNPTMGRESLREISNDNVGEAVYFATYKNLFIKSTMFPHLKIHKYTWTSSEGNTHFQLEHVLIDRRRHSDILDVRSFRGADCGTDHYLVVAKVRQRLAVSKGAAQKIDTDRINVKMLN